MAEIFSKLERGDFPRPSAVTDVADPAGTGSDLPEGDGALARGPLCLGGRTGRGPQALDRTRAGLGLRRVARRASGPMVATASDLGRGRDRRPVRVARDAGAGHSAGLAGLAAGAVGAASSPSGSRRISTWTRLWPSATRGRPAGKCSGWRTALAIAPPDATDLRTAILANLAAWRRPLDPAP